MNADEGAILELSEALHEGSHKAGQVSVPAVDVAAIRATTGLSQSEFARSIGVAKGTLLNWEHGRRHPTGPAQVLLALIAKRPSLVGELLG